MFPDQWEERKPVYPAPVESRAPVSSWLLRPDRAVSESGVTLARAAGRVASVGLVWALLLLWLYSRGHAPSRSFLPIAPLDYYLWQAAFVVPVMLISWLLLSAVAQRTARALGGSGEFAQLAPALATAYAAPLLWLFLVPDIVVFALFDFDALRLLIRVSAPLSGVVTWALCTRAVGHGHGLGPGRALLAAFAGLVVQAAVGGVVLR